MRRESRTPIFIGNGSRRLFCCLHEPVGRPRLATGIVLCYPFGQEYLRAHRSFVQLAARLAARGFPVLRFDYHGTGDSAGDIEDARLHVWVEDVSLAANELRQRARVERLAFVGCRLGAALALQAADGRNDGESMVLWDPVLDGRAYVAELRSLHREMLRFAYLSRSDDAATAGSEEVLGFALPAPLRADIESLDLLGSAPRAARRILLVATEPSRTLRSFHERLQQGDADVELLVSDDRKVWLGEPMKGIVPHRLLESVVNWFDTVDR